MMDGLKTRTVAGRPGGAGTIGRRVFAAVTVALLAASVAGCAAPPKKTTSRGVGRPPPEQAPVVYSGQNRSGPLITPDSDPFAVR